MLRKGSRVDCPEVQQGRFFFFSGLRAGRVGDDGGCLLVATIKPGVCCCVGKRQPFRLGFDAPGGLFYELLPPFSCRQAVCSSRFFLVMRGLEDGLVSRGTTSVVVEELGAAAETQALQLLSMTGQVFVGCPFLWRTASFGFIFVVFSS
jgi:hypothetical protein